MNIIVIDTNIFMSALIRDSSTRLLLTNLKINFLFPEFEFKEIEKYKQDILKKSKLSEKEFNILYLRLLKYVRIIPTDVIIKYREESDKIIGHIDNKDTIFVATALAFNCPIW